MKKPMFTGVCTALVTPFLHGSINYPMVERLLARQVESGIPAVVLAGTTGEAPTLSEDERFSLIRRAKEFVGKDCLILAGTGSNATAQTVRLSLQAQEAGADALLVVTPYYNKATEEGLFTHYLTLAQAVSLPIVLYNVPSRTGLDIPISLYRRLSRIPNIAGVKEAGTDVVKILRTGASCGGELPIWAGNDDLAVAAIALGAQGVISVTSNVAPAQTQAMVAAALDGDFDTAADLQRKLLELNELLFREINPIPVKAAMKLIGYDCGDCRLPLTPLSGDNLTRLKACLST